MRSFHLFLFCLSTVLLPACDLTGDGGGDQAGAARTVFVANGGNFSDQNGTVTSYDPESGLVENSPSVNGFLQGLVRADDRVYALVNTFSTGRVHVLDIQTMRALSIVVDLPAPRDLVIVGDSAYVSNFVFGAKGVVVPFSLATLEKGSARTVGEVPEGMAASGGRIFVANNGSLGTGRTLSILAPGNRAVATLDVPCDGPRDLFPTGQDRLVVICTGKTVYGDDFSEVLSRTNGAVLFVSSATGATDGRIDMEGQLGTTNGTRAGFFSPETDELYVLAAESNMLYGIDVAARRIAAVFRLPPEGGLTGLSGIAYDAEADILYVGRMARAASGDFPDFTSSGSVLMLDRGGNQTGSFTAGPAPSEIVLAR